MSPKCPLTSLDKYNGRHPKSFNNLVVMAVLNFFFGASIVGTVTHSTRVPDLFNVSMAMVKASCCLVYCQPKPSSETLTLIGLFTAHTINFEVGGRNEANAEMEVVAKFRGGTEVECVGEEGGVEKLEEEEEEDDDEEEEEEGEFCAGLGRGGY